MLQAQRHRDILGALHDTGQVTVEGLAAQLQVTQQTIRRDLSDLAEIGALERVHGGAVLPSGVAHLEYDTRRRLNADAKERIGRACAALIPHAASVFLGIGTTVEAVARALICHRDLLVVTNNLHIAAILGGKSDCELVITGGQHRTSDHGLVGHLTVQTIETFRFDHAVLGVSALDAAGSLLDFDLAEVQVNQALLRHARETSLVADQSKFRRAAPIRVGTLASLSTFVTDVPPSNDMAEKLNQWQTRVVLAPAAFSAYVV